MKGAKGGKRDKKISFLLSEKNKQNQKGENEEIKTYPDKAQTIYLKSEEEKDITEQNTIIENEQTTIVDLNINADAIKETTTINTTPTTNDGKDHQIEMIKETKIDEEKIIPAVKVEEKEEKIKLNTDVLEKEIIETVEQIVREDLEELEEIAYEIEVLNNKQEEEILTDETEKLKDELQDLLTKFEKIKNKYYPTNLDNDIINIDDELLYNLLQEYKDEIRISNIKDEVSKDINKIENYITIMQRINNVEDIGDEIEENIDEKLDEFEIRDEDFEVMKDEYSNTENTKNEIKKIVDEQNSIIKDLNEKIANTGDIRKRSETNYHLVTHLNRLVESAILIGLSKRIPPTPRGRLIRASMIISAVTIASRFITTEQTQKEITTVEYTDFTKDIMAAIKDVDKVKSKIDDAFVDIDTIREKLKGQYSEFVGKLDDYDELLENLDNLEGELDKQKNKIEKYDIEFKNVLTNNNQKVKRLETIKKES